MEFTTSVRIACPLDEVFAYVADPLNFPRWNSAVQAVRKTSAGESGVASTYSMERELPTGRVVNELEIVAHERPGEFALRTTLGPTPFAYRYRFAAENGETVVQLDAAFELEGAAALLGPLAARAVRRGVDDNFAALKEFLELRAGATAPAARLRDRGRARPGA
ncbi:MAG: SRPBCC family protein [Gaiellaceae bacterium]